MESFKFHNLWKDWWERTSKHDVNLFSFFESWMKILRICLRVRRPEIPCSRVALCWRVHMIINKNCLLCINCPFTRFTELTDIRLEKISAEIVIYWNTKPSVEKLTKGIRSRRLSCHRTGWYLEGEMLALNQNVTDLVLQDHNKIVIFARFLRKRGRFARFSNNCSVCSNNYSLVNCPILFTH